MSIGPKTLTVLICTYNRADLLARVLASLQTARRPAEGWRTRILVMANACTDGTHALLEAEHRAGLADPTRIPLDWLPEPQPGKSHALNTAIPRVSGDTVVAFADDDHRVDAHFLEEICRAADTYPEATMFCGRILPDWDGTEPAWVHDEGPYRIRPRPIPMSDSGPISRELTPQDPTPGGGNLFLRGAVLDRVGHFSTDLGPQGHNLGGGEDSAFVQAALAQGERLRYVPGVLQYHYVDKERLGFGYVLRKAYQRSRGLAAAHAKGEGVPLYMWRKLAEHLFSAMLSLSLARSRHYLVRIATTLGEMAALSQNTRRPLHHYRDSIRDGAFLLAMMALAGCGLYAGFEHQRERTIAVLLPTLLVAGMATMTLGVKSFLDFTHTGPRLGQEILEHYRLHAMAAFARLLGFAFLLLSLLAMPGALALGAAASLLGTSPGLAPAIATSGLSLLLLAALQFSRHLLWLPANIAASYNYRLSRLYPYWQTLTPRRLRAVALLLLGILAAPPLLKGLMALGEGGWAEALAWLCPPAIYAVLGLWLRPHEPRPVRAPPRAGPPNIILLGSDTLRSDRLDGTYGREVAPNMRHVAKQGALFSHCYVPCARTAPSLVTLLTGLWPHRLGVRDNFVTDEQTRLGREALAGILKRNGYHTVALSDWCGADMGKFDLGFEHADVPRDQWNIKLLIRQGPKDLRLFLSLFARNHFGKRFLPEIYYLGGVPMNDELGRDARRAISALATQPKPFLLNIFLSTTHGPFGSEYPYYLRHAESGYRGESKFVMARLTDPFEIIRRQGEPREEFDLDQIINLYDGCVTRLDDEVRRITDHVEHCGLGDNTLLVLYSDHGMEFFEHNTWGQGNSAIAEVSNRVPLLIRGPGVTRKPTTTAPVRSIDLMPTLLELAGIPPPSGIDGVSFASYLRNDGPLPELDAYCETGIWLTELPGTPKDHLRYPNLLELLTVRDKASGTISLKPEYETAIVRAKDRMIRDGRWKLVYQPLVQGHLLRLYDLHADPACTQDLSTKRPDILNELWPKLAHWICEDHIMACDAESL